MISKSIRKHNKHVNHHISEISLQSSENSKKKSLTIPKFLDPIKCFRLYGDICFNKDLKFDDDGEIGLLSNYNYFKRVGSMVINQDFISLLIEKTTDELHHWDFLISRLNSLNDKDAHELGDVMSKMYNNITAVQSKIEIKNEINPANFTNIKKDYKEFCNELEEFCKSNANSFYSFFRYKMESLEKGLELQEIRHSKRTLEFFAGSAETFSHLILEQGVLDIWTVDEKAYFPYMIDSLTNYLCAPKPMQIHANTMEGYKVNIAATPFRKMFMEGPINEIVAIMSYEISEEQMENIRRKRNENWMNRAKKSFRNVQLNQILGAYYDNYFEKNENKMEFQDDKIKMEEGYEYNNTFLSEKKRCGIKLIFQKPMINN